MSKKLVVFLILLFLTVFIAAFFASRKTPPQPPSSPPPAPTSTVVQQSWKEIVPGKTTPDALVATLGQPIETKPDAFDPSSLVFFYPSSAPKRPHEVVITNNTVTFVRELLFLKDGIKLSGVLKTFSRGPVVLYGPSVHSETYLYAYPTEGVAFLGNASSDSLFEAWYFAPTTIEELLQKSRFSGYSLSFPQKPEFSP